MSLRFLRFDLLLPLLHPPPLPLSFSLLLTTSVSLSLPRSETTSIGRESKDHRNIILRETDFDRSHPETENACVLGLSNVFEEPRVYINVLSELVLPSPHFSPKRSPPVLQRTFLLPFSPRTSLPPHLSKGCSETVTRLTQENPLLHPSSPLPSTHWISSR